jgi:hypothetical protein
MANEYNGEGGLAMVSDDISAESAEVWSLDQTEDAAGGERPVHYYFPVEIEVRNSTDDVDRDAIVAEALRRLTEGIRGA